MRGPESTFDRTRVETVFVLFLSWDLKYTGLVTNSSWCPLFHGGPLRDLVEVKTHNEKASMFHDIRK